VTALFVSAPTWWVKRLEMFQALFTSILIHLVGFGDFILELRREKGGSWPLIRFGFDGDGQLRWNGLFLILGLDAG
jgi:hypothetical protein